MSGYFSPQQLPAEQARQYAPPEDFRRALNVPLWLAIVLLLAAAAGAWLTGWLVFALWPIAMA